MFYKKKYRGLHHKLLRFVDALEVQLNQYKGMLEAKSPYELEPERRIQVETLQKHTLYCLENCKEILKEENDDKR